MKSSVQISSEHVEKNRHQSHGSLSNITDSASFGSDGIFHDTQWVHPSQRVPDSDRVKWPP